MDNQHHDRLSELFERAIELSPGARAHFIEICSDDPAVRAELLSLLAAYDRTPNMLERIADDVLPAALQAVIDQDSLSADANAGPAQRLASTPQVWKNAAPSLEPGRRLGTYTIQRRTAAGGLGIVYHAFDTALQREVAIKTLAWSTPDARETLLREARAASALNHPHICTIYEVGEHDGIPFIAMEYLDGRPLRDVIPSDGLPSELVVRYGIQVAEAVEHAHRRGIIHRDLKSANVMVSAESQAKVLDFGLASRIPSADMETLTRSRVAESTGGALAGTLAYLAPELLRGNAADKRSDIWALGVLLYEMAAGQLPFRGATPFEVAAAIVDGAPAPLPAKLPVGLRAVIRRCLARNPAERYQHGGEVRVALETLQLGTDSAVALRESTLVAAPHRRRRGVLIVAGAIALVLAGAAGLMLFNGKRTPALTDRDMLLVADFVNTTGDSVFDGALKQALSISLEQSPFLSIVSREEVRDTLRLMTKSPDEHVVGDVAREACQRLGAKAMIEGSIVPVGSHYAIGLDAFDCQSGKTVASEQAEAARREEVLTVLSTVASTMRHKLGESLPTIQRFGMSIDQATTSSLEALKAFNAGEEVRGRSSELGAVPFYERAIEIDPDFALAYARLAAVYGSLGQVSEMQRTTKEAYTRRNRVSERERFYIDGRQCAIGAGLDCFTNVMELWKRTYPRDGRPHGNLSGVYGSRGECDKALENGAISVQLDPGVSQPYVYLARAYMCLGKPTEARETLERAISRHLESPWVYLDLFGVAFLERDERGMARARQWAAGRPEEALFVALESNAAAFNGRMRLSREARMRAERLAAAHLNERGLMIRALGAVYEAAQGDFGRAHTITRAMFAQSPQPSVIPVLLAAAVLSRDYHAADAVFRETERQGQLAALGRLGSLARVLRDLDGGESSAVDRLPPARPTDVVAMQQTFPPAYLRGLVYLHARDGLKAAAEFQRMLEYRDWVTTSPLYPLAYVQQARAYALSGEQTKARKAYEDFFALWKDADPDIPILGEAKAEYARLTASQGHGQ
jgi:tetratricopeptide (TPR) repeat protein/predicted Ser/Thr protein kinase